MDVFKMWDHELLILYSFALQFEFVDVVEMRVWVLYSNYAVDVIFLYKDTFGDLFQQIKEREFIVVWNLVILSCLFFLELSIAFGAFLFSFLLISLIDQQKNVVWGSYKLHHLYLISSEMHLELVEILFCLLEDLFNLIASHLYMCL